MKYFSTFSARMTVVRKEGYYMSVTTARRVVKKLAYVLEFGTEQAVKAELMLTLGYDWELTPERCAGFTPAQLSVIDDLVDWYMCESYMSPRENPCFIALNLNRGYSLVISEGHSRNHNGSVDATDQDEQLARVASPGVVADPTQIVWDVAPPSHT